MSCGILRMAGELGQSAKADETSRPDNRVLVTSTKIVYMKSKNRHALTNMSCRSCAFLKSHKVAASTAVEIIAHRAH